MNKVDVSIERSSDGLYWNGSIWVAGLVWNLATGTTSWNYTLDAINLTDGVTYTIESRATDNATNVQSPVTSQAFTYDTTAPSVTVNQASGQADPTNVEPDQFHGYLQRAGDWVRFC